MNKLLPLILCLLAGNLFAAPAAAPDRVRGEGPFERLVLREVMMVNGEGAPPNGPVDILVEGNRIAEIRALGILRPIPEDRRIPIDPGSGNGLDWVAEHRERSEANTIAAPRIVPYVFFGQGVEGPFTDPEDARAWVQDIARRGAPPTRGDREPTSRTARNRDRRRTSSGRRRRGSACS